MTKLTISDIADEILKVFDLDGEALAVAMEELHNRVKAQEADPEVATKMLTESFLAALRRSNEKECCNVSSSSACSSSAISAQILWSPDAPGRRWRRPA